MALLTSSATRNAIYKSFARRSDNIGDITAKGEAQLALVDLAGMLLGVSVSRVIGASRLKIAALFVMLSLADTFCTFHEIRSVVFASMNFERAGLVLTRLLAGEPLQRLTPDETTLHERLLFPAELSEGICVSWSGLPSGLTAPALARTVADFEREQFLVSVSATRGRRGWRRDAVLLRLPGGTVELRPRVLLRESASHADMFQALLVVHRVIDGVRRDAPHELSETQLLDRARDALAYSKTHLPEVLHTLREAGWNTERFMFSNVTARVSSWGDESAGAVRLG